MSDQTLPRKQKNLDEALRLAEEELRQSGISTACSRAGVSRGRDGLIRIESLGNTWLLDPEAMCLKDANGCLPSMRHRLLMLHYIARASGAALTGKQVSFAEIPGAAFYAPVFAGRIRRRTAKTFGPAVQAFENAGESLKGKRVQLGDAAMTFLAFPRVPITIVIWKGDDEFEPESNFIFDSSISSYLCVEDIVVTCEELVGQLTRIAFPRD